MDAKIISKFFAMALTLILLFSVASLFSYMADAGYPIEVEGPSNVASEFSIRPIIRHVDAIDKDFDGIQDSLETLISQMTGNRSAIRRSSLHCIILFSRANSLQGSGNIETMNDRVGSSSEERCFPVRNKTLNEDILRSL